MRGILELDGCKVGKRDVKQKKKCENRLGGKAEQEGVGGGGEGGGCSHAHVHVLSHNQTHHL